LVVTLVLLFRGSSSPSPDPSESAEEPALSGPPIMPIASDAPASPASASPPGAPANAPGEVDGIDAAGWQKRLKWAADTKKWIEGSKAFAALAKLQPTLLRDEETRALVVLVAAGIAFENNELSDQVFNVLSRQLSSDGPDVLYE